MAQSLSQRRPCGWSTGDGAQSEKEASPSLKTTAALKSSALLPLGASVLPWCFSCAEPSPPALRDPL